jgi:peptidoglycan/xylan/chitin deacetylase (PgdA/CDA1 family)
VHATWAAVGLLLFDNKKELLDYLPQARPRYANRALDPYADLPQIGASESTDPYHYGLSLARRILDTDGMEIGTHTFSHYYCLERGQTEAEFRADLLAAIAATERLGTRPRSLVFPRNQFNPGYLRVCRSLGIACFRGNESSWLHRAAADEDTGIVRRACRLADAYVDISGHHGFEPSASEGLVNIPASRFLRPFSPTLRGLEKLRKSRIKTAMTAAAKLGLGFHLWWHPHNFGTYLEKNLANLAELLAHFAVLRDRHGMESLNMGEYAARCARSP